MELPEIKFDARTRGYLYGVGLASLVVVAAHGVITEGDIPLYEGLLAAVLGMARRNARD